MKHMVEACPICDSTKISHRGRAATKEYPWKCRNPGCLKKFTEPTERESKRLVLAERIKNGEIEI